MSLDDTNEIQTIRNLQNLIFDIVKDLKSEPSKEQIKELKSLSNKMAIEADKILTWDDLK